MTLTIDDIICPRCAEFGGFVNLHGRFFVDCKINSRSFIEPRVACAYCVLAPKPTDCSPNVVGWCTGDCKKCEKRSEWEVWAE